MVLRCYGVWEVARVELALARGVCGAMLASTPQAPRDIGGVATLLQTEQSYTTKKRPSKESRLVGLPGFEPRMTGPESVVLPLHHSPMFLFDDAKVEYYFVITKKIAKKIHIFVKIFAINRVKQYKTH